MASSTEFTQHLSPEALFDRDFQPLDHPPARSVGGGLRVLSVVA